MNIRDYVESYCVYNTRSDMEINLTSKKKITISRARNEHEETNGGTLPGPKSKERLE